MVIYMMSIYGKGEGVAQIRKQRMIWGVQRYLTEDGKLTKEAKARYLTEDQITRINSGVEQLAKADMENGILHESEELAEWQKKIMEQNKN